MNKSIKLDEITEEKAIEDCSSVNSKPGYSSTTSRFHKEKSIDDDEVMIENK